MTYHTASAAGKPNLGDRQRKFLGLQSDGKQLPEGRITPLSPPDHPPPMTEEALEPSHILIVDDEESFGQMLEKFISGIAGLSCTIVDSAEKALETLTKRACDVVITDIRMPDMDGLELTRIIKENYDASVIIMTGFSRDFSFEEAIRSGGNDFIQKPLHLTELLIRLQRILRERASLSRRKQAEKALLESEKRYRDIFDRALEGIFQVTPQGRFVAANKALAGMLGYKHPQELMEAIPCAPSQLCASPQDCETLLKILEWSGSLLQYTIPLKRKDERLIWASLNLRPVTDSEGTVVHFEGNIEDITLQKQAEEEREQSIERIRKALGATVQALAATSESRDPYTAGHQRRVADLARAIATEMDLTAEQLDGIRMAGTIHDLGKISVPAEILSSPRKLTDLEFSLIKTHAQGGYDILKDIDFPWPIARIVLEHHERIDGSGYPRGLSRNDLLIESRILAVADVVEAIASHRPYRPSLGTAAALEEITSNKGIYYDPDVADACIRLFQDKGYQFKD